MAEHTPKIPVTHIIQQVLHFDAAFFRAHPERWTSPLRPNDRGYWLEPEGDTAWLHQEGWANLFHFRRLLPDQLETVAPMEAVTWLGRKLVMDGDTRALVEAGRVWVNAHNATGFPVAFVVAAA